jgi:hypothetical protein
VTGQLWLAVDRKVLLKGTFAVPAQAGGKAGAVTVVFSKFDSPVTITKPA